MSAYPLTLWRPQSDNVYTMDCFALMRAMPSQSVDLILTDPPYGNFKISTWDNGIDIETFVKEAYRILKPDGFFVFTIQMPAKLDWMLALRNSPFRWQEEIVWLKRLSGRYRYGLLNSHETLLVYGKERTEYHETRGLYTDVKVPGLMFDAISIDGIQRHIADLQFTIKNGQRRMRNVSPTNKVHSKDFRRLHYLDKEDANFTNVWSFLPQAKSKITGRGANNHPTIKPILMFERAVRCFSPPNALVFDPFVGSGTTALAAYNTARHYIVGDTSAEYVEITRNRLCQPYERPYTAKESAPLEDLPLFAGAEVAS